MVLGSALLVTSAYAGIGSAPGYDAYKSAVKTTLSAPSLTEQTAVTVTDNGATLLSVDSVSKTDKANRTASADIKVQGGSVNEDVSVYRQDGEQIVKTSSSDVYNVFGKSNGGKETARKAHAEHADAAMSAEMENVVDALVGNLKDYVSMNAQPDGSKSIDVQLTGSQIPAAANAVGSFLIKHAVNGEHPDKLPNAPFVTELQQIRSSLPKLSQDVKVTEVDLNAVVDGQNHITKQTVNVTVSGKDAQGALHEVVVHADIGLSAFGSTTPDKVDLTGKQVQTVQRNNWRHEG
jgi:hypothetical protein